MSFRELVDNESVRYVTVWCGSRLLLFEKRESVTEYMIRKIDGPRWKILGYEYIRELLVVEVSYVRRFAPWRSFDS